MTSSKPNDMSVPADEAWGIRLVVAILQRRALILDLVLLVTVTVGVRGLVADRKFTSESSFIPDMKQSASRLSGIAQQLGVQFGASDASLSPTFYSDLVTSRPILAELATMPAPDSTLSVRVMDLIHVPPGDSLARRDAAVRRLADMVRTSVAPKTGVVHVSVTATNSKLAADLNRSLLDLLNQFNLKVRQTSATAQLLFAQGRVKEAAVELRAAEDRAEEFRKRNRDFRNADQLSFEYGRLTRDVELRSQLYISIAQAYEQARLEVARDTPVLTIVEMPETPSRPDPRGLVSSVSLGALISLFIGIFIALAGSLVANFRGDEDGPYTDLTLEWQRAAHDLRRPWRLFWRFPLDPNA